MDDSRIHVVALGDRLCSAASRVDEIVLIAPFIKRGTLGRLIEHVDPGANVVCITRWRPEEVVAGVSDLDVWPLLRDRGWSLGLVPHLHAKYYRFGGSAFMGSANLTATALGWRLGANLELLIEAKASPDLVDFETAVRRQVLPVDDTLYEQSLAMVDALRSSASAPVLASDIETNSQAEIGTPDPSPPTPQGGLWLPTSRSPSTLYSVYCGEVARLTHVEKEAALLDLAAFPLPKGLGEDEFVTYVGWYLLQLPVVRQIDELVTEPRRFGSVRSVLRRMDSYPQSRDASRDWQTLMRWLLYFRPSRYHMWEANYSEIFARRS